MKGFVYYNVGCSSPDQVYNRLHVTPKLASLVAKPYPGKSQTQRESFVLYKNTRDIPVISSYFFH